MDPRKQQQVAAEELDKFIRRMMQELDLTWCEVIGILQLKATQLSLQAYESPKEKK